MTARRVETDRLLELVRLHRMGSSARAVVRILRMGPNTERRYRGLLERASLLRGAPDALPPLEVVRGAVVAELGPEPRARPSPLEAWLPRVEALLDKGLSVRAVFDRLRLDARDEPTPFRASYSALKRAVRRIKRARRPDASEVVIPVEGRPGESAQVDFGYAGKFLDPTTGVLRRAWVFVLVARFSRLMWVKLVFDQSVETWLRLHEEALADLAGCFETLVPDNTKRAVLRAAFSLDGPTELNRSYRELARHYGFTVDPCPPGAPRLKGVAEAAVRYVLSNGLAGRQGCSIDEAQAALQAWNREIASKRVHGTTGRRPIDVFEQEERAALRPLPAEPCELAVWKKARVHPDCHVAFRQRLCSVPWTLVHDEVWIRAGATAIQVFHHDRLVATHSRHGPRRSTLEEHLPPDRRHLRLRGRSLWEQRAARIGPATLTLVRTVFDSDDVLCRLRQVQAVVHHLEAFPRPRAEAAARRALDLGDLSYQGIKRLLLHALDLQHLERHA